MSAPVDVLAVRSLLPDGGVPAALEWADRQLRVPHEPFTNDSYGILMLREARAAVAELYAERDTLRQQRNEAVARWDAMESREAAVAALVEADRAFDAAEAKLAEWNKCPPSGYSFGEMSGEAQAVQDLKAEVRRARERRAAALAKFA